MSLYHSTALVILNGCYDIPSRSDKVSRKGPLLPFLFIFAVDSVAVHLRHTEVDGELTTVGDCPHCRLSLPEFVDETLVFSGVATYEIIHLKALPISLELSSGLETNLAKSFLRYLELTNPKLCILLASLGVKLAFSKSSISVARSPTRLS